MSARIVFTLRSWDSSDGDAAAPRKVLGIPVTRRLCLRRESDGALVALGDRRYALTGRTVAVGSASQLRRYIRQRAHQPLGFDERQWLDQVITSLDAACAVPSGMVV